MGKEMKSAVRIRKAEAGDAVFIAERIHWALGNHNPSETEIAKLSVICGMDDTLYSFRNTFVAEYDGERAGIIVCYDGALYKSLRIKTFELAKEFFECDFSTMADETKEGEFYLDSLAVTPEMRHKGIGKALMQKAVQEAKKLHILETTLLVDPLNSNALRLYKSLGFAESHTINAFGYNYMRMSINNYNIINIRTRKELRDWYTENASEANEMYLHTNRGAKEKEGEISYIDAVEEALCFGWIDSVNIKVNGVTYSRFSPRRKNGNWTELNKARCRRLIRLGLMTEPGSKMLPCLTSFAPEKWIVEELKKHTEAWKFLQTTPPLYFKIKLGNIQMYHKLGLTKNMETQIQNLIKASESHKLTGQWNDNGRLRDDE